MRTDADDLEKIRCGYCHPVLNANLPELKSTLQTLRLSGEDAVTFESADQVDRDVFGRVIVGSLTDGAAYTCITPIEHLGRLIGTVKTSVGIREFALTRIKSEAASIAFFWVLSLLVILISNYRALKVLSSVNDSLAYVNTVNADRELRDLLNEAISSVPRNAGTAVILDSLVKITDSLAEMADLKIRASRAEDKAQLARQVGHDIRSPLSALRILIDKSNNLNPAEHDLLTACYRRVDQVAKDLLTAASPPKSFDLVFCIEQIIEEKRLSRIRCGGIF